MNFKWLWEKTWKNKMCVDVLVNWCLYGIKLSLRGKYFFLWCRVLRLLSHSITSNGNQRRGNKFQTLFQTNKLVKGNPTQHKGKDKGVYKMLKIWRKIGQTSVVNILRTFPLSTQWKWWILPISTFCTGASPWNHYSSLWHICTGAKWTLSKICSIFYSISCQI